MENFMRTLILTIALVCGFAFTSQAQQQGDWYVGAGDISNIAWTDWSVSPTIGYGVTSNLMVGASINQADSTADMDIDFHARYLWKGFFGYLGLDGFSTDGMTVGAGKMFTIRNNVYIDPKVIYNTGEGTTNLTLGFGFKF
jgi:hypothetical protein